MFTGLIESVQEVLSLNIAETLGRLTISARGLSANEGDSVAVDGCCLTVVAVEPRAIVFEVSTETLRCTNFVGIARGQRVNIERAMTFAGRFHGHVVSGHVDGVAKVLEMEALDGGVHGLTVVLPERFAAHVVERGSLTLNGVSLTIVALLPNVEGGVGVRVCLIPATWEKTNLADAVVGDELNFETDILAKYLQRIHEIRGSDA